MSVRSVIVIGGSAGAIEPLHKLVAELPPDLPAAVLVVIHLPSTRASRLPEIITKASRLQARHPANGEAMEEGVIYVAPPDHHLLVEDGRLRLSRGARENHSRPAIDPLFRTAASAYGARTVALLLSGILGDGTAGMVTVKQHGGAALVQDPASALFPDMPRSAMHVTSVDAVVRDQALASALVDAVRTRAKEPVASTARGNGAEERSASGVATATADDSEIAARGAPMRQADDVRDLQGENEVRDRGEHSMFACPDCGGVLWELRDGELVRYRCRVGHAYTGESLLHAQTDQAEEALWTALRSVEEQADLARGLARRMRERRHERGATRVEQRIHRLAESGRVLRALLEGGARIELEEPELLELEKSPPPDTKD